ncbi:MAG: VCBS repeat-containing protein [Betaproteobacteria bacterium]|nr:VCBS repeat-containing protein [Betaproteobacteria bacterium]
MRPARKLLSVTVLFCAVLLARAGSAAVEAGRSSYAQDMPNGVRFVVGNDQWQPGRNYKSSADWLALNCTPSGCSLEPARLTVKAESWQGHYDDKPTRGQKLNFRRLKPGSGSVIAWFQLDAKHPWLKPGAVTTHASSAGRTKRPPSEGTLEVAIDLPDGKPVTLVPLYDRENEVFLLQLREPKRRQMLGQLAHCSREVASDFFLWAGDLDDDGRPDYLISFVDDDGQVVLYLGGAADQGEYEIAGIAGVYDSQPGDFECDGEGWLENR